MSKRPPFVRAVFDLSKMTNNEVLALGEQLGAYFKDNKVVSFGYKGQSHCDWIKDPDCVFGSRYKVGCDDFYQNFDFGDVHGNGFEYCPYCGMGIVEVNGEGDDIN